MKDELKYLSKRICIAVTLVAIVIAVIVIKLWIILITEKRYYGFVITVTCAICIFVFLLYRLIIKPYKETMKIFEQFAAGYVFDDIFKLRYPLTLQSSKVIDKFDEILDKNKLINVSKKQSEYLALQNQINPHFLYNTLEGIRSEALIVGLDSVAEMTEALATFFRYTISHVEHLVTLEDELANIENYYYIQQFRFGDKLALNIEYEHDQDLSEFDMLKFKLPKLTLQPIVENSIYHGIERKVGKGHLTIKISSSDERLRIKISDDGQGMSDDKLKEINNKLKLLVMDEVTPNSETRGGIALVNVNNRIKLLFGEEYGLYVYSNLGTGTDVIVSLPLVTE